MKLNTASWYGDDDETFYRISMIILSSLHEPSAAIFSVRASKRKREKVALGFAQNNRGKEVDKKSLRLLFGAKLSQIFFLVLCGQNAISMHWSEANNLRDWFDKENNLFLELIKQQNYIAHVAEKERTLMYIAFGSSDKKQWWNETS